ncbi:MAG: hypothetical protein JSU07_00760 [Bacteroidetes bacterium]|nr:hypothetical protein [Bacteroidota bacterium]
MELVTLDVYTEFASETEGKIKALTARLAELEKNLSNPSELINYTCKLATNLVKTWDLGDYYQKQVFQNTLFPSGLGYDAKTEQYRTTTVNSVFALITELSKVSYLSEKKTSQDLPEKSDLVPPSEPNVNQILEDTRALAQIWDLYGHLLTEDKIS